MKSYKYLSSKVIQWYEQLNVDSYATGNIIKGQTRTRLAQDGTEQVQVGMTEPEFNKDGNISKQPEPIYEEYPKFVEQEYSPWDELMAQVDAGEITIEGDVAEIEAELAKEQELAEFKAKRHSQLAQSKVTSGAHNFDANETAINRMLNAIVAANGEPDNRIIEWSTADVGTGEMVEVTLGELRGAHRLAVQNMGDLWKKPSSKE